MTKGAVENEEEDKIVDGRVEVVDSRGKAVEIVELSRGEEAELSLTKGKLDIPRTGSLESKQSEEKPMEVEDVAMTGSTSAEMAMSIEPSTDEPPATQSIVDPVVASIFEPLPMSTEPSLKNTYLSLPAAMSVSPQVESRVQTAEMRSDDEESLKDGNKSCFGENEKLIRRGETPRQGIRVLLPKGGSEPEGDVSTTKVENSRLKKGSQEQEDALFKSPMRPALSSPARTVGATLTSPPDVPAPASPLSTSGQPLGNLSPASLPSPGHFSRSN